MPQNRSFSQQPGGSINIKKFKTIIIRINQQEEETPVVVYHQDEEGGISLTGDQIVSMSKRWMQILNALKSLQNKKKLPMVVLSSTPGFGNSDLEEGTPKPIKVAESRNQLLDLTPEPSIGRGNGSMMIKRNFFVDNAGGTFSA
jgi:hypothetical protein